MGGRREIRFLCLGMRMVVECFNWFNACLWGRSFVNVSGSEVILICSCSVLQPLRLAIKRKLAQRSERVKCVDLHPTEPWILSTLYTGSVYIWNYQNQVLKWTRLVPLSWQILIFHWVARTQNIPVWNLVFWEDSGLADPHSVMHFLSSTNLLHVCSLLLLGVLQTCPWGIL